MAYASPAGSLPAALGHGLTECRCPVATLERHRHLVNEMIISPSHMIVSPATRSSRQPHDRLEKSQVELKKCRIGSPMLLIQVDLSLPSSILFPVL